MWVHNGAIPLCASPVSLILLSKMIGEPSRDHTPITLGLFNNRSPAIGRGDDAQADCVAVLGLAIDDVDEVAALNTHLQLAALEYRGVFVRLALNDAVQGAKTWVRQKQKNQRKTGAGSFI